MVTGSRIAVQLGRVPAERALRSIVHQLIPLVHSFDDFKPIICTWVDNAFWFSSDATNAMAAGMSIEDHLRNEWGSGIKSSSTFFGPAIRLSLFVAAH